MAKPNFRFTTRNLLLLTTAVALTLAGVANFRQLETAAKRLSTTIWNRALEIQPPLMGRESVDPEW